MLIVEALRNIGRRRARSALTIFGIVIGVLAITVMGGLSEYFNRQIDGAVRIAGNTIGLQTDRNDPDRGLTLGTVRRIERIDGVRAVVRTVQDSLEQRSGIRFGLNLTVVGIEPEYATLYLHGVDLTGGRWLQPGDTQHAVIGSKVASTKRVGLGDTLEWRKKRYAVVGVMETTETFPDQGVVVPFDTVRRELRLSTDTVGQAVVVPEPAADPEAVAAQITRQVPGITALSPQRQIADIRQGLLVFNAVMLSGAVIAGIVGGLSVVNTMVMAVRERTREIGLKKAIGAPDGTIVGEFLSEAVAMGLVGGGVGILLGLGMAQLLNAFIREGLAGTDLFTVTPRLLLIALGFAVGLGGLAGLYPSWSAARLDPVQALRNE